MPVFTVNKPIVLATGSATPSYFDVLVNPDNPSGVAAILPVPDLTITDAVALTDGTVIYTAPAASVPPVGTRVGIGTACSTGLTVKSIPPGVSIRVSW
jgi:hypothetical protein